MNQETTDKIIERLELVSQFDQVTRFIDILPSNGYIRSTLLNKHPHLKYSEAPSPDFKHTLLRGKFNTLTDILYVEIPTDFTYKQHEELANALKQVKPGLVAYSSIMDGLIGYYKWARVEDSIISNDRY